MPSTAAAIRDRFHVLIEALAPTSDTKVRFRRYRNEGDGNFQAFAEANPAGAHRRFQVRDDGAEDPPEVSNTDTDMRHVTYVIQVAYPATGRYGVDQALDRDDVIDQDWGAINSAIGIYGRANFTVAGGHDCTPLGAAREVIRGSTVDILEVRARASYYRTVG